MVKKGYYGDEGFGLLWDRIGVAPGKNGKKWGNIGMKIESKMVKSG